MNDQEKIIALLTDIRDAIVSSGIMLHTYDQRQDRRDQAYAKLLDLATRIGVIAEEAKANLAEDIKRFS
jgi:hypothetical protein